MNNIIKYNGAIYRVEFNDNVIEDIKHSDYTLEMAMLLINENLSKIILLEEDTKIALRDSGYIVNCQFNNNVIFVKHFFTPDSII